MGRSNLGFKIEDMEHFEVSQSVSKGFDGLSLIENTLKTSRMKNPQPFSSKPLRTLWRLQQ